MSTYQFETSDYTQNNLQYNEKTIKLEALIYKYIKSVSVFSGIISPKEMTKLKY